jgi:hypothetical protein
MDFHLSATLATSVASKYLTEKITIRSEFTQKLGKNTNFLYQLKHIITITRPYKNYAYGKYT